MTAKLARLSAVQSALQGRGALDVKFFFAPEAGGVNPSTVVEDLTAVLDHYLKAEKNPLRFNDTATSI